MDRIKFIADIACKFYSLPLYFIFWIADLIYAPQLKWQFLLIRMSIIPTLFLGRYFTFKAKSLKSTEIACSFLTMANAIPITVMVLLTGNLSSPYYAGLNLVAIGIGAFFPWSPKFFAINMAITYLPILIVGPLFVGIKDLQTFILNGFFMLGTLVIASVIKYINERIYFKEFEGRLKLEDEVQSRGKIIEIKTQEAVQMSHMTKQFSPQVLHAIKSGELDIFKPVHRSEICAIFIDIVNSTERLVRIDRDDLHKVLGMFMEDTMPVLLKYDITIDKFLGDGILAFSNDPMKHSDYIERVLLAATEIISKINDRQDEYYGLWMNDFQLRIGISCGFASVGFYGNENTMRSYTAIGRVMNLASRLCSAAQPNQILTSFEVYSKMKGKLEAQTVDFELEDLGVKPLKGFEADKIKTFNVKSRFVPHKQVNPGTGLCPNGHGVLFLETNELGFYELKCRTCKFVAGSENKTLVQAA
ncbi:MAG TPA: adenylate/guanylate cyclase domain-containing protein [Bacteriovoracaceae bacterium]|nr:adenylate/guanylate cyclase domain-containing protein [Bacteriovoracaceae bacterium]